jgi:hypothetical protein
MIKNIEIKKVFFMYYFKKYYYKFNTENNITI